MNVSGLFSNPMSDGLERMHSLSGLQKSDWLDLLGLSWKKYYQYKIGLCDMPSNSLANLSKHFDVREDDITSGAVNFQKLEANLPKSEMPDRFLVGAHGRRRTTITSLEYLEKAFGWRLKYDVLNHFQVSASELQDPFASINIQFITEMAEYLKTRQFKSQDFFRMGLYSVEGNRNSLVGKLYSEMESVEQIYTFFFHKMMSLFENNCIYKYQQLTANSGMVVVQSSPDVASELKVSKLGSHSICELKAGMFASLPAYLDLNNAVVTHFTCEHKGDDACRFHIDQVPCTPLSYP